MLDVKVTEYGVQLVIREVTEGCPDDCDCASCCGIALTHEHLVQFMIKLAPLQYNLLIHRRSQLYESRDDHLTALETIQDELNFIQTKLKDTLC